jgi:integrase
VGRKSRTGGVTAVGTHRIRFDFMFEGRRFRPSVLRAPTDMNMRRAREQIAGIRERIAAGTFSFADEFPNFRDLKYVLDSGSRKTCGEVFDAFLAHCESRRVKNDLAPITVATYRRVLDAFWRPKIGSMPFLDMRYSVLVRIADEPAWSKKTYNNTTSILRRAFRFGHRDHPERHDPTVGLRSVRIRKRDRPIIDPFTIQDAETLIAAIHRDWGEAQGNYDEFRFFTGLRPSEQIALLVSDFDPTHGTLGINKACVGGIHKDSTKTGEDRRIELCPRAVEVLSRQLALRDALIREGKITHNQLFFKATGEPIRNLQYAHSRWRRTLARLPSIRYRKPYCARHSSVSWNLMTGGRPLWVAKQHGHSITTMLNVYAAWTDDASEADLDAIELARSGAPRDTAQRVALPISTAIDAAAPAVPLSRAAMKMSDRPLHRDLALDLAPPPQPEAQLPDNWWKILAEREGFEPSKGF